MLTLALAISTRALSTPRVLVYTATAGYRHDSIPTAIQVLGEQASSYNVSFVFSEDPNMFTNATLAGFDGVMFVLNSDEVLNLTGQAALQTYFQSGGVYTGVHSGSACLFDDTNYQQAIFGNEALFDYHPQLQSATFVRLNDTHPATVNLPDRWTYDEEVYYFRSDPRSAGAVALVTVDETSYVDNGTTSGNYPTQGTPHPIAWYIESPESAQPLLPSVTKAGRSFYTALGHLNTTWQNETFMEHVMSGLVWALEGASTKAYGVGLVGNEDSSTPPNSSTTSHSTSSTSNSVPTAQGGAGGSATSTAASASSSKGGGLARADGTGGIASAVIGVALVGVGVRVLL
ncbi:MAG: hypothetical protein TREMPRED_002172 [Tremellales sp. Tagirdzhanova-0007]|nr:MAG: hypothetical protein TREMPRED_002172 [Tremellales sp. Tagirdzhanova-0007]